MKGAITLGIYVAIGIIGAFFGICMALAISVAAFGQSSTHVKTVRPVAVPEWSPAPMINMQSQPATPPGWKRVDIKPVPLERVAPDVIVIKYGQGGRVYEHKQRFADYRRTQAKVEVRGPCYSACTLLLSYVEPANLCIGEKAFMAFHAVRSIEREEYMESETLLYFLDLPQPIQQWINVRVGSWKALPLDGYVFMRDRELWAIGYPKCQ